MPQVAVGGWGGWKVLIKEASKTLPNWSAVQAELPISWARFCLPAWSGLCFAYLVTSSSESLDQWGTQNLAPLMTSSVRTGYQAGTQNLAPLIRSSVRTGYQGACRPPSPSPDRIKLNWHHWSGVQSELGIKGLAAPPPLHLTELN